jgi:uncharacterized protein (TIGR03083 family)
VDVITREEFEELLGAFALDACDTDEMAAIERYIAAHPEVVDEVERLRTAAAGLAASDALAPPRDVRNGVFQHARARRAPRRQTPLEVHAEVEATLIDLLGDLPEGALGITTLNGLTVREIVAHLAAMESLLAMWLGVPTLPDVVEEGVEERTASVIDMTRDWTFAQVIALWRQSMAAVRAAAPRDAMSRWFGSDMPTDLVLIVRAFETWTHTDDIRRAIGRPLGVPSPAAVRTMAEGSMTMVPSALESSGLARPGRAARIVLTGPGGGDWTVAMAAGADAGEPDVSLTLPVVDWCRRFSDRLSAEDLDMLVNGDRRLGADIVAAAPVFASL